MEPNPNALPTLGPTVAPSRAALGAALAALGRCLPAAVAAVALLHAHRAVPAACRIAALPWCPPEAPTAAYFASPAYHLSAALSVAVGAAAMAVAAAVVAPCLARVDSAAPAHPTAAGGIERTGGGGAAVLGRALVVEAVFLAVALPGFAIAGWLAVQRGAFGPDSAGWAGVQQVQSVYQVVAGVAVGPLHALWLAGAVGFGQPVLSALRQAAAALRRWPAAVGGPLVALALLRPDHAVALASLAGFDAVVYRLVSHPLGAPGITLAYAVVVVVTWAVAVELARPLARRADAAA